MPNTSLPPGDEDTMPNKPLTFSHAEEQILLAVMANDVAPHEAVIDAILSSPYARKTHHDTTGTVRQITCILRKKLAPYGLELHNQRGVGYYMTAAHKARLYAMVTAGNHAPLPGVERPAPAQEATT